MNFKRAFRQVDAQISAAKYSRLPPETLDSFYLTQTSGRPFCKIPMPPEPEPAIVESLTRYSSVEQFEYLIHYPYPLMLEPRHGLAITNDGQVIREAVPYDQPYRQASYFDYLRFSIRKIDHEAVIHLRYNWENFWHTHNDILGQLMLCDRLEIPRTTPIIFPASALKLPWVPQLLNMHPGFRDRTWLPQQATEILKVRQAYFPKNMPNVRRHFDEMLEYFPRAKNPNGNELRLFIQRSKTRLRSFRNTEEVEATAKANGFEVIDCEKFTVAEQIELFARAPYVVGTHGAALTNTIHRRGRPCSILEIFPVTNIPPHFFWLASELGYRYDALLGKAEEDTSYEVDVVELDRRIKRMIS